MVTRRSAHDPAGAQVDPRISIATHYMLHVRCKHIGCVDSDFLGQTPVHWYTEMAIT